MRFGIGRPPGRQDPADFVLCDFSAAERKELEFLVDRAADAVEAVVDQGRRAGAERLPRRILITAAYACPVPPVVTQAAQPGRRRRVERAAVRSERPCAT